MFWVCLGIPGENEFLGVAIMQISFHEDLINVGVISVDELEAEDVIIYSEDINGSIDAFIVDVLDDSVVTQEHVVVKQFESILYQHILLKLFHIAEGRVQDILNDNSLP